MRSRTAWVLLVLVAGLALGGCRKAREQYDKVAPGMTRAEVQKILGAPEYEFADEWVYTGSSARDLGRVTIYFSHEGDRSKVVGKSWQNPDSPAENDRTGEVP
jgi:outer membrane protein assembly factor BamE (lipoprotein component of BamABCDE complex)